MAARRQPNILFLFADQFRGDVMSCVGGSAKTPNLDSIAREGVLFTNCSTAAPLCVPARVSLFTGKYPHTTGAWNNLEYVLSPDANLWTKEIRELGYETSLFGKTHLHTNFGDMIEREYLVRGYGFDTVDEIAGPHAVSRSRTHLGEEWKEKGLYQAFCEDVERRGEGPHVKPSPLPLEDYYDVYVGRKGREYLENYSDDKPWFCHVSFSGPHEPWDTPEPYASMYKKEEMPGPLSPHISANPDRPRGEADDRMENPNFKCSPEQALALRADYCGGCTLIDDQIGQIIEVIKARGEWENTIVVFTSDHGEMNGDQGFIYKRNFFRGALQVPLVIRTPETAKKGGRVTNVLVSLLDVGPTLAELAGKPLEYEQFGRSLCGILEGSRSEHRDYVLSECWGEVMYMDREWKVATNNKGQIYLLFDVKNDPDEQYNLAGVPEVAAVTDRLRRKMMMALAENQCLKPAVNQMYLKIQRTVSKHG